MHTFKFLNKLFKDIKIELIKNLREQLTILRNRNKILKNSLQNNYHYKFNNNNNDFSMNFNVSLIGDYFNYQNDNNNKNESENKLNNWILMMKKRKLIYLLII